MTGNPSIVMIVDDDNSIRKSVRRLMKAFGVAVETFASAEEFLGSDRLDKTSCLILDVHYAGHEWARIAETPRRIGQRDPDHLHHGLLQR